MAGRSQITCINKPNRDSPVEHITRVGGVSGLFGVPWNLPVEEVIRRIESRGADHEDFYVRVGNAEAMVIVVPASPQRRKHIRTKPDATQRDNLLSLPECP